ncbi:MAG: hypothetical protein VW683_13385 [Betaproteobacteria bacterium]
MATWTVWASQKKSTTEREFFKKDGQTIIVDTVWRTADFTVETTGDEPPAYDQFEEFKDEAVLIAYSHGTGESLPDNVISAENYDCFDGVSLDIEYPSDMPESEQKRLAKLIEEEGDFTALDSEGWEADGVEYWIEGPLDIEPAMD